MLTLILFLDFIQEIFGVVSRKFCLESAEGVQNSGRGSEHSLVIPHLLLQRCFPRGGTQKCSNMHTQV